MQYLKVVLIGALAILAPLTASAGSYPNDFSHSPESDKFSFQDVGQLSHMFAGATMVVVGQAILVKAGMKPIPAILTAVAFSALVGATKEVFVDGYCSRAGIQSAWFGAAAGGLTMTVLQF